LQPCEGSSQAAEGDLVLVEQRGGVRGPCPAPGGHCPVSARASRSPLPCAGLPAAPVVAITLRISEYQLPFFFLNNEK